MRLQNLQITVESASALLDWVRNLFSALTATNSYGLLIHNYRFESGCSSSDEYSVIGNTVKRALFFPFYVRCIFQCRVPVVSRTDGSVKPAPTW